jgi:hypothetical protein
MPTQLMKIFKLVHNYSSQPTSLTCGTTQSHGGKKC